MTRAKRTGPRRTKPRGTTSREPDDGQRGKFAVVVSLVHRPDGTLRVVLDDARATRPGRWSTTNLFTSRDYPAEPFRGMGLDATELEKMGWNVLARLAAMAREEQG